MNRLIAFAIAAVLGVVAGGSVVNRAEAADSNDLAAPLAVTAGGIPIERPPFAWFGDFDGDGRPDLLVGRHTRPGKRKGGVLHIYKNTGQTGRPRFGDPLWFDDLVPTGRIPKG